MKRLLLYALSCAGLLTNLQAQTFEYTENKGQWPDAVQYRGVLSHGAFFLQQTGYRVLQYHPDDMARLTSTLTGHQHLPASGPRYVTLAAANRTTTQAGTAPAGVSNNNNNEALPLRGHVYDVRFVNGNARASRDTRQELVGYSNYFIGNDKSKWASGVKSFGEVWYRNMYPGIDVRYYSEKGFLKYELVCAPGANLSQVVMEYDGANGLQVDKNGELVVRTSVGDVREEKPYVYQVVNGQRQRLDARYDVVGNRVRFRLSGYQAAYPVVIDPTLIFSSFTGSPANNWGYTATYDGNGNLYAGGIVLGPGYPVTPGAFQQSFAGGGTTGDGGPFDMGIMKFNATGTQRVYATYLGGSGNEQPHSLVVDASNNLVIAGRTTSVNFPKTTAQITGPGGNWDITVTKLNTTGTALVGSMQMGGRQDDGVNIKHKYTGGPYPLSLQQNYGDDARSEVVVDGAGNIWVASCTRSTDFPLTAGGFQNTLRGEQDALVLRINPTVSAITASTLVGGGDDDAAYVIRQGLNGNVYVAGGTVSADFPGDKSNTIGTAYFGGGADGFIAEFNPSLSSLVKSTFVGTNGLDQVYGISFDRLGFFYFMGTSTGNFPVQNAAFSQPGGKQFIAKVQPDLSAYVYSTVFGTNSSAPNISPTAFLVDRCENVYVSGWGGQVVGTQGRPPFPSAGTTGLTVTSDAIQSTTDGRDFYFFVLEKNATRQLFGSFFGQLEGVGGNSPDHVDGGTSRFDEAGIIYQGVCANCGGGQYPTTPGVVGPTNPSGTCNQAVIKIAFDLSGVRGGVKSSIQGVEGDTSACVPVTINFRDTIAMGTRYEWDFGDGTPAEVTSSANNAHTFTQVGIYRVRLISVDSLRCFPRDTSYVNIRIREDEAPVLAAATKLPPCESNTYRFDNLSTPYPGKPFSNTAFTWIFGDNTPAVVTGVAPVTHQFPGAGTYDVRLVLTDTNYCNAPDTFRLQLRVSPLVDALFNTPAAGCAPYQAQFTNTSLGGTTFRWSFGDGATSTAVSPTHLYSTPGTYTVKLVAVDSSTCNIIDSTEQTITVSGKPRADFSFAPNPPEENIITTFTNLSDVVPRYKWLFGDGDSLLTFRRDTLVRHQYNETGTYNACIIAINQFGCADTLCRPIPAIVNPLLDVVSAFTPNGDGVNDRALAIGYGVAKLTFRIYNRWGQLMFETNSIRQGWDGRFKGNPQPMDAYGYTLEAEFVDGKRLSKSGSITLVR